MRVARPWVHSINILPMKRSHVRGWKVVGAVE